MLLLRYVYLAAEHAGGKGSSMGLVGVGDRRQHQEWAALDSQTGASAGSHEVREQRSTIDSVVAVLQRTALYSDTPGEDLTALARAARPAVYSKGDIVAGADGQKTALLVVADGRAQVCRLSRGGRLLFLREVRAGDIYGLALLGKRADTGNMLQVASSRLRGYHLPAAAVEATLTESATLCLRALHLVNGAVLDVCAQSEALAFEPMRVRLAHMLAASARESGGCLVVHHTREELAAWIGCRYEEVSRVLAQLAREGLVRAVRQRSAIEVLDRDGLMGFQ
jgi:CRP-like cAMP-binding protein